MSYEMLKDACLTNAAALYTIESVLLEYIRVKRTTECLDQSKE